MTATLRTAPTASLAYEVRGTGEPIVFVHGLTFDRTTWSPIVDRLAEEFCCITVDLPGHGESAGPPRPLSEITDDLYRLLGSLGIDRPVIVGHSMGAAVALLCAASYPVAGVVDVDQSLDIRPFVERVQRMEPLLNGADFAQAFEPFRRSMGVEDLAEPERSRVADRCRIEQPLVMGYFDEVIRPTPEEAQRRVEGAARAVGVPCLAVFGHELDVEERRLLLELLPHAELEVWPGRGHLVHLVEPERFACRLRRFARHCIEPCAPYDLTAEANRALFMGVMGRCLDGHDLAALHLYTENPRVVASMTRTVTGFPDVTCQVEWAVAEGDMVAGWVWLQGTHLAEWRGFVPTGRRMSVRGSVTVKVVDGEILDFWICADWLRMYQQLGLTTD